MRRIAVLLSFALGLAVFQPTEEAASAVHTFRPSADTYVDEARPNRSFGSATRLRVRAGSRPAKQVYVRFTVAGLAGWVTRAKLRFYVANGTRNGPAVYRTARWPRKPLTWTRRPAVVSGPRDNKGRLAAGAWVEWDVTPWVRQDGAYRFILKRGSADAVRFMSRETRLQPQLVVTTSGPPSTLVYVAPRQGATVSGVTPVRVRTPAGTDWIGVYACGGTSVGEDHVQNANFEWSVQWNTRTTACSNGTHDLDAWAFRNDGSTVANTTITVKVNNSSPPPPDPEPTRCAATPQPDPIAGQGYALRFSDCFGTLSRSVWCSNQWWEPTPPPGTQYVADGALHLVRRRSDGYPNVTVSTEPCGQANPESFQYGYMEARMRYDTVRGNGPAFWLLSTRHATNPNFDKPEPYDPNPYCQQRLPVAECWASELDVFEGFGNIEYGGTRTDDFFSGTLHRNSSGYYGIPNSPRFVQRGTGLDLSQWHVYAALWTESTVSYYIDDELQGSVDAFDSTQQPMHLLLYNWNTDWEDENMPNAGTPDRLDVSVDWVRVWQQ
jgi:Glycosyl hydrolases family 16